MRFLLLAALIFALIFFSFLLEGEPHKDDCVLEQIDIIEEYSHPLTASDTFLAGRLKRKEKNIKAKIKAARSKNLTNCTLINFEKNILTIFQKRQCDSA